MCLRSVECQAYLDGYATNIYTYEQCTAICMPAIMARYVQLSARHTCKGATGMPGTQGMQGSRRGLSYPHDSHICRGAPRMPGIQKASMGPLGLYASYYVVYKLSNFQQIDYIFGLVILNETNTYEQFFLFMLAWHIVPSFWSLSSVSQMPLSRRWCSIEKRRPASHNHVDKTG